MTVQFVWDKMQPFLLKIFHNIEAFKGSKNIDALNKVLAESLSSLGIKTYSFSNYSVHPRATQKLKYEVCSPSFKTWHEYYLSEQYEEVDSTLHLSYLSTEPFVWILKDQLAEAKTERERQMRLAGIQFGAIGGITVPIHGPNNEYANLTLIEMQSDDFLKKAEELMPCLFLITYYYYSALFRCKIEKKALPASLLTEREMACLKMQAHYFSVANIAKKLKITPRTVHFHLQNVNKKLGVANKFEAVNKALEMGVIVK